MTIAKGLSRTIPPFHSICLALFGSLILSLLNHHLHAFRCPFQRVELCEILGAIVMWLGVYVWKSDLAKLLQSISATECFVSNGGLAESTGLWNTTHVRCLWVRSNDWPFWLHSRIAMIKWVAFCHSHRAMCMLM